MPRGAADAGRDENDEEAHVELSENVAERGRAVMGKGFGRTPTTKAHGLSR